VPDAVSSLLSTTFRRARVEAQGLFPLRPQAGSGSQACPSGQVIRAKKLEEIAVKVVKK
jgi:hypothetical protein